MYFSCPYQPKNGRKFGREHGSPGGTGDWALQADKEKRDKTPVETNN